MTIAAPRGRPAPKADAPRVSNVYANPGDVLGRFSDLRGEDAVMAARQDLLVKAASEGQTLTALLEEIDPSSRYPASDPMGKLDAFERALVAANIRTRSDVTKGIYAHTVERFYLSDQPASPVLFPEYINRQIRVAMLAPPILDEIIAITTPVDSDSYRTIYLQDTVSTRRMARVAEGAELPVVKVLTSEKAISLHKYGLRLQGSYEAFRRMRIDLFALHLSRIALQTMLDKSSDALDVAINGDGNSNPATNYNLTTLDPSTTAGHLTYYAWLNWGLKLWPYQVTTVVAGEAELLAILTLQFPNINPLTLLAMINQGPVDMKLELAQNIWGTIRLVYLQSAPSNVITGISKGYALELVTEIGATLTETDRLIRSQWNEIAISEVVGFGQILPQALQTLTLNA